MSVRTKALHFLKDGKAHSKYEIRDSVLAWQDRHYDEQSIDRTLQHMVQDSILRSKKIDGKIYYKIN